MQNMTYWMPGGTNMQSFHPFLCKEDVEIEIDVALSITPFELTKLGCYFIIQHQITNPYLMNSKWSLLKDNILEQGNQLLNCP